MKPCFLNVDLEINSASKLDIVIAEMGKRVLVLRSGPASKPRRHLLVLESSRQHRGPSERSSRFTLRFDMLERVARLCASLAVSYYRGVDETHEAS